MESARQDDGKQAVETQSLREVLQRAQASLATLQAKREYLRGRIQALRYLATHAEDSFNAETQRTHSPRRIPSGDLFRSGRNLRSKSSPQVAESRSKLARACRIALMETDEPQSGAQIYERIVKRGSMTFEDHDNPLGALTIELQRMASHSEIACSVINGETSWRAK